MCFSVNLNTGRALCVDDTSSDFVSERADSAMLGVCFIEVLRCTDIF